MENQKLKEMGNKLLIIFLFMSTFLLEAQIKYNTNSIIKKKCAVYFYPFDACLHCKLTNKDIIDMGCYGYKFDKINPKLFLQLDTLLKYEKKTQINKNQWTPYTVLKIQYKDTILYLTINIDGIKYERSDMILKDSIFTMDKNIISLLEQNVKGFKKAYHLNYVKVKKKCK